MAQRHERTQARRAALQLLYSAELTDTLASEVVESGVTPAESGDIDSYARMLIAGVEEQTATLDSYIKEASQNWALTRMPIVDKTILRVATFEMLFVDTVPMGVSINEAVELAKDFGGADESHRFVNGVLGNIAKRIEQDGGDVCAVDSSQVVEYGDQVVECNDQVVECIDQVVEYGDQPKSE